jgi:hypothetical protein
MTNEQITKALGTMSPEAINLAIELMEASKTVREFYGEELYAQEIARWTANIRKCMTTQNVSIVRATQYFFNRLSNNRPGDLGRLVILAAVHDMLINDGEGI